MERAIGVVYAAHFDNERTVKRFASQWEANLLEFELSYPQNCFISNINALNGNGSFPWFSLTNLNLMKFWWDKFSAKAKFCLRKGSLEATVALWAEFACHLKVSRQRRDVSLVSRLITLTKLRFIACLLIIRFTCTVWWRIERKLAGNRWKTTRSGWPSG